MQQVSPAQSTSGLRVQLRSVSRVFGGGVEAVRSLDLNVDPGEFVALVGPSGCGKSTLLRLVAGLDRPNAGSVLVAGAASETARIAYVFQDAHLLPWRSVLRNVALPLELLRIGRGQCRDRAMAAIEQVGLVDAVRRYPMQLSGGMRMRVSLARALVTEPKLLLLDEPFAALDEITRQQLDDQLRELWIRRQMTVLFVTHSITEATFLADRAVVLTRRPARIVLDHQIDLPEIRGGDLRGTPEFARQTAVLLDALHRGGAW